MWVCVSSCNIFCLRLESTFFNAAIMLRYIFDDWERTSVRISGVKVTWRAARDVVNCMAEMTKEQVPLDDESVGEYIGGFELDPHNTTLFLLR